MTEHIPEYQDLVKDFPLGHYELPAPVLDEMNKVTAAFGPYICAMVDFFKAIDGVDGKTERRNAHRPMKYCMERMDAIQLRHQSGGNPAAAACSGHVLEGFHPPLTRDEFAEAMRLQLCLDFAYDILQSFGPVAAATMQSSAIELSMNSLRMALYRMLLNFVDNYIISAHKLAFRPTEIIDFELDIEQSGQVLYVKGVEVRGYILNEDGTFKDPAVPDPRKN